MPGTFRPLGALGGTAAILLAGCMPGERVVRVEVVNTCPQNVKVRLAFAEGALATVAPDEIAAGEAGVIEAIYPGSSAPLLFAVSRAADDQPRVALPPLRADKNDALRLMLAEPLCSEIRPA